MTVLSVAKMRLGVKFLSLFPSKQHWAAACQYLRGLRGFVSHLPREGGGVREKWSTEKKQGPEEALLSFLTQQKLPGLCFVPSRVTVVQKHPQPLRNPWLMQTVPPQRGCTIWRLFYFVFGINQIIAFSLVPLPIFSWKQNIKIKPRRLLESNSYLQTGK